MNLDLVKVLLIDDDEDDHVNIRGILSEIANSKFELTWAPSYQEGLRALRTAHYDACLLDFRLGEFTGLDLLREAKGLGIDAPMILLTGHGDLEVDLKAMQSGAADYLIKGKINAPLLERAIRYSMKQALDMSELAEQRENFKVLFNSTFEGIVVHRRGDIVDANAAIGEILGVQSQTLTGTHICQYLRPDYRSSCEALLASDEKLQTEVVGIKADGTEIFLSLSGRRITLKGERTSIMAIRDLTQQRLMETQILQQDRMASLGLLASSLAHEIGTPLGVIRGRAEMLNKVDDPRVKATVELITGQIDRISKLVGSLLQIARGQQSESVVDVLVEKAVADVTNLMSHELENKGIALRIAIPPELSVRAEAGPLGQVFLNLMVNSVYAIEELQRSGVNRANAIEIGVTRKNGMVEILFRDTGAGITEANLRQLFKPFFTTKDVGVGTGLGLATSYKILRSWGGSIAVESKVGEGTTFKLLLKPGAPS